MNMPTATLEERVATLEKEFATLKQVVAPNIPRKDWRDTFGMFADDPEFDDVLRRGREFRQQANQVPKS